MCSVSCNEFDEDSQNFNFILICFSLITSSLWNTRKLSTWLYLVAVSSRVLRSRPNNSGTTWNGWLAFYLQSFMVCTQQIIVELVAFHRFYYLAQPATWWGRWLDWLICERTSCLSRRTRDAFVRWNMKHWTAYSVRWLYVRFFRRRQPDVVSCSADVRLELELETSQEFAVSDVYGCVCGNRATFWHRVVQWTPLYEGFINVHCATSQWRYFDDVTNFN